jgi:hypothetical protein
MCARSAPTRGGGFGKILYIRDKLSNMIALGLLAVLLSAGAGGALEFGSVFQTGAGTGSSCGTNCLGGNVAADGACLCPALAPLPHYFEAATDCAGPPTYGTSRAYACFPGTSVPAVGAVRASILWW